MLSQLQNSYQRVEQSLQRLVDSIAAYNPSIAAAEELSDADDLVNTHLEQLIEHQQNYLHIEELTRVTRANDEALREQLRQLVHLRNALASLPSYEPADITAALDVDDLLIYAKYISKTTVPPTFRMQDLPSRPTKSEPADAQRMVNSNGVPTPPDAELHDEAGTASRPDNVAVQGMPTEEKVWLDPLAHLPFEPWPSADIMQRGALADIQRIIDRGEDPATVLSPEEQAEADRKNREEEEKERLDQEERERRRRSMYDVGRRITTQDDVFDPDA